MYLTLLIHYLMYLIISFFILTRGVSTREVENSVCVYTKGKYSCTYGTSYEGSNHKQHKWKCRIN